MDGVLVVDKPAGPTSHDIVERVRRTLDERRAGHTGTLDPFATGVLPICLGKATRLARFVSGGEKEYHAGLRLGFATTTDDVTGEPLAEPRHCSLSGEAVEQAVAGMVGSFDQVPPAFSAKRVGGRRLYELARRGEAPPRPACPVTVYEAKVIAFEGDSLELAVRCSPGTYVRALARDLGERLGVGGHLKALRRTRSGSFDLSQAVSGDDLEAAAKRVIPLEGLLVELPAVCIPAALRKWVKDGRDIPGRDVVLRPTIAGAERVRLLSEEGKLLALALRRGGDADASPLPQPLLLHPDVVLVD